MLVHGDDFVSVGNRPAIRDFSKMLSARLEIKTAVIGTDTTANGFEMEADQRHTEMIIE